MTNEANASLEEIRANAGNLSIPLYVRKQGVSDARGEYAADGLTDAVRVWDESAKELGQQMNNLLEILTKHR